MATRKHPSTIPWWQELRCIRVIGLWHLKPGFRPILSSNAQKCTWKVHLYKPFTSVASESQFNHANRIPYRKVGVIVSKSVKVIKMSRLSIDHFAGRFIVGRKRHRKRTTPMHPKHHLKLLAVLTVPIRSRDCIWNYLSAFDQNHKNIHNDGRNSSSNV